MNTKSDAVPHVQSAAEFAASVRKARRADPDGKAGARKIRAVRKARRDRWLARQQEGKS